MKKNSTESKSPRQRSVRKSQQRELTIGVDLGDTLVRTASSKSRSWRFMRTRTPLREQQRIESNIYAR